MSTADERARTEEPKDDGQEPGTARVTAIPAAAPRQGDPVGATRTRAEFEPSVNNRAKWVAQGRL